MGAPPRQQDPHLIETASRLGGAPTYEGDERRITCSDAGIKRRDAATARSASHADGGWIPAARRLMKATSDGSPARTPESGGAAPGSTRRWRQWPV